MDHEEAQRMMLAERYLLDELAPEEKEEFEDHFFDCADCALDVRAGSAFIDHSRGLLSEGGDPVSVSVRPAASEGWWPAWLRPAVALPVLLALGVVIAFQNLVTVPELKHMAATSSRPQVLPALSLINVAARGANSAVLTVPRNAPFLLFVDIPAENRFSSYIAELYDSHGNLAWTLPVSQQLAKDTVPIRVPGCDVQGNYSLTVRGLQDGGQAVTVGTFPFVLQFEK
jgi:hypothetical protein